MPEEKKKRLNKYQKSYCEAKKCQYDNEQNNFNIYTNKIIFLIMI